MFKEIGRVTELLKYPQSIILGLDKVAHINSDDLTLTITSEECAELIQAISKIKRYGFRDVHEENLHEEVADVLICITELVCLGYLDIDKVADYQKLKINREIERTIQKEEEKRKELERYGTCK
ncbi:MazG nucleotide pyrophosphohydrolase domain-containing protein [uncultured Catenibacterium sp.]|uniref:MazG nucleotide pyrophosphohydrolase domain-containing protein n=1 Tax=uncultured Catenibacterium sp. TaxID=286142 RepID=UPI0025E7C362|nr:MazG nucleotide pyrophosphohydrolase domain-containing protein [uncultured Catenibacterium sp.]